jgi:hypothetical protein
MAYQITDVMPKEWSAAVGFKTPNKDDKLGYIDSLRRGTTFRMLTAEDTPLSIKSVRTPFECFTVADCMGKGRGKLTVRVQINRSVWESLQNLDTMFKAFLISNRHKLFGAMDAEYIGKDPSAIALKYKGLAPFNPDGSPHYDAFITVRINGRAGEIEELLVKENAGGRYVSGVTWSGRSSPLGVAATRFSVVTGVSGDKPIIRETMPVQGSVPVGAQRVRYVGPGDIDNDGCVLRYATIRPAYWSLAPGGGASISLVFDYLVIQNVGKEDGGASVQQQLPTVPEGFTLYDDETGEATSASNAMMAYAGPTAKHEEKKRRIEADLQSPMPSARSSPAAAPDAPRKLARSTTGGGKASSGSIGAFVTARSKTITAEQEEYTERIEREMEQMKRDSVEIYSQRPAPFPSEEEDGELDNE